MSMPDQRSVCSLIWLYAYKAGMYALRKAEPG